MSSKWAISRAAVFWLSHGEAVWMVVYMLATAIQNALNKWLYMVLSKFLPWSFLYLWKYLSPQSHSFKGQGRCHDYDGGKNPNPLISAKFLCSCFSSVRLEIQGETCARLGVGGGKHGNQPKKKSLLKHANREGQSLEAFCCLTTVLPAFVTTSSTVYIIYCPNIL